MVFIVVVLFVWLVEVMDKFDRPIDSGFFTGFPNFHELKYKLFRIWESNLSKPVTLESRYKLDSNSEVFRKPTIVKKTVMEGLLSEQLSDEQVSYGLYVFVFTEFTYISSYVCKQSFLRF